MLANNPEGNMWYEMSLKKDLVFLPLPEDLRQKLAKEEGVQLVEIPFRYMRGVGDVPVPTVGSSGSASQRAADVTASARNLPPWI